jgi:hypothetical protein
VDEVSLKEVSLQVSSGFPLLNITSTIATYSCHRPPDTCYSSDHAAHYHMFGLYVWGFVSDPHKCCIAFPSATVFHSFFPFAIKNYNTLCWADCEGLTTFRDVGIISEYKGIARYIDITC